jgi:hypothetical protein
MENPFNSRKRKRLNSRLIIRPILSQEIAFKVALISPLKIARNRPLFIALNTPKSYPFKPPLIPILKTPLLLIQE